MTKTTRTADPAGAVASGEHETRLARNYLARQSSHITTLLIALGVTIVLARRLPLSEFGTYALLLSLTAYITVLQGVVEASAVKAFAEAIDQRTRDRAFSTVLVVNSTAGVLASALVIGVGWVLLEVWTVPPELLHQARKAIIAMAIVTVISWPVRVFYDALRGNQLFGRAAAAEAVGAVVSGGLVVVFVLAAAPLWLVVSAAAGAPLLIGVSSALIVLLSRQLLYRLRRDGFSRKAARSLLGASTWFFIASLADFVIYSLDRTILGAFRPAATVGLYEGPIRAHALVRDVQAVAVSPVFPAAARFWVENDAPRLRDLMLRGTRYLLAIVVPVAVVEMVLARPILVAFLGERFGQAAPAATILVGYWLVYANTSVGWNLLTGVGQIRQFALFAAAVAALNAALSLALTPSFGLNGIVLGTAIPYVLALPFFLRWVPGRFGVSVRELAHEAWAPAYSTATVIAAALAALRVTVDLETVQACVPVGLAALLAYWLIYYAAWLRPDERRLARALAGQLVGR